LSLAVGHSHRIGQGSVMIDVVFCFVGCLLMVGGDVVKKLKYIIAAIFNIEV
jgi:hypothetical protein